MVGGIDGISFVRFDERDVVRHKLVREIVMAYDAYASGGTSRETSGAIGASAVGPSRDDRDRHGS